MTRLIEVPELRITSRTVVRPGDRVRLSKGPVYKNESGDEVPLSLRGTFQVVKILRTSRGKTTFLEVYGLDKRSGFFTVKVEGKPKKRLGVNWRPYKVKKLR